VKNINLWIIIDVAGIMRLEWVLFPVPWAAKYFISANMLRYSGSFPV